MIYDLLSNSKFYSGDLRRITKAITFAKRLSRSTKDGRIEIDGDAIFASVSSYTTKMDRGLPFEAHKKYIDLQCLLKGRERIDVAQGKTFRTKDRYSSKKDILFVYPPEDYSSILLVPGQFAILYPQDLHRPGQGIVRPEEVHKLVIKIRIGR